jgi:phosphatidylglycerophosphate synthase
MEAFVPDPSSPRAPLPSVAELRRTCQDPVRGFALRHDPLYRAVSIHLTRLAIRAGARPHQVTLLSLGAGLAAALALAELTPLRLLLALALIQIYLVLDYVDGELARFRGLASLGGRWLEQAGCYAVDPFLILGLGGGTALLLDARWPLALGVLGALTQLYFALAPVLVTAVITSVHMGTLDRSRGEATPAPTAEVPPLDRWGRALAASYPLYRRLRFPFFHPNLLLLLSLACVGDLALGSHGPLCAPLLLVAYGLATPPMALWQALLIVHLRVAEERYRALYLRREPFREHV